MRVVLSEASGQLKALYGDVQKPVAAMLEHRAEEIEKQESILFKAFKKKTSNHFAENYRSLTEMDEMMPVGENGPYPFSGFQEGYDKTIKNVTYKGGFGISRELMDDNVMSALGDKPDKMLRAYYRGRARNMAAMLGNALQGNEEYTRNGYTFNTTGADGVCVFSKTHTPKVAGSAQSNLYKDAFSSEALFAACMKMSTLKDDNGNTLSLHPSAILLPTADAKLVHDVITAIASLKQAENANNGINPLYGALNVYTCSYLNDFVQPLITAGGSPWILLDESYIQDADCAIYQERVELEIRSELGDNDENLWKAYARYGLGFVDFRGMMAFGVASGSTL